MKREAQACKDLGEQLLALADDEFASVAPADLTTLTERNQGAFPVAVNLEFAECRERRFRESDRLVREREAAADEFEALIGRPAAETRELVAALDRVVSDREEKGLRRDIFRAVFDALAERYDSPLADTADGR